MVGVKTVQLAGGGLVVILIAVIVGWVWGAWGASEREGERRQVELRLALTEARGRVLEARLDFNGLNFRRAGSRLETAKRPLEWARRQLRRRSREDLADRLTVALAYVAEAQVMAGQADLDGHTRAIRAVGAIDTVLDAVVGRRGPGRRRRRSRGASPEVAHRPPVAETTTIGAA